MEKNIEKILGLINLNDVNLYREKLKAANKQEFREMKNGLMTLIESEGVSLNDIFSSISNFIAEDNNFDPGEFGHFSIDKIEWFAIEAEVKKYEKMKKNVLTFNHVLLMFIICMLGYEIVDIEVLRNEELHKKIVESTSDEYTTDIYDILVLWDYYLARKDIPISKNISHLKLFINAKNAIEEIDVKTIELDKKIKQFYDHIISIMALMITAFSVIGYNIYGIQKEMSWSDLAMLNVSITFSLSILFFLIEKFIHREKNHTSDVVFYSGFFFFFVLLIYSKFNQ